METTRNVAIIIPSLNPDEKLLGLLDDLRAAEFRHIVLVNDGSAEAYDSYFETARTTYGCTVLTHAVNQGKGRALKTAFHHILTAMKQCVAAVTVDADGQHRVADIVAVSKETVAHPDGLVFGCRDFSPATTGVPARSRFGNILTSRLLKLLCGITLSDTQTGLRGFSVMAMRRFLATKGERYEFEMNMILDAKESNMPLYEVPIETVYIEDNQSSHFNPLKDSLRIYSVFAKFIAASLSSFVVDILLYTLFVRLLTTVIVPTMRLETAVVIAVFAARVLSALFNFTVNRNGVFKSKANAGRSMLRYALLCVVQVTVSAFATGALVFLTHGGETAWKIVVDIVLFLVSFRIQRGWVFK
jgi:glycosyltransferase involved in cell wall biosynthesis